MSATIRQVVYDLLGDFKQLYDDAEITPFKMFYWVMVHADRLRKQHIEKIDSGLYVTKFDVVVHVEPNTGRNYFDLPGVIYDMDKDNGISYITYDPAVDLSIPTFGSVLFTRTTPEIARRLYFRASETPTPNNPYFYLQSKKVYLLGIEQLHILSLETGLRLSLNPNDLTVDIDQPLDFPQDLIPILKRQILDMGRFVLTVPRDLSNDGSPLLDAKGMPTNKIVSVADVDQPQNV